MTRVLICANIYTLNPQQPHATAIVIDGERILRLGARQEILTEFAGDGHRVEILDARHQTLIPGLIDAHFHLEQYALAQQMVDCETPTRAECERRVAERAQQMPPGEWVLGHGWNQNDWPEGFGNNTDLDAVSPKNPVYLTAKSLHAAWANSLALEAAGIGAHTSDPPRGRIGRNEHGEANGILFEGAMELVQAALPEPTPQQVAQAIRDVLPKLARMGLTGLHDFDQRLCFSALQILHQREELTLRVVKSIPLEDLPYAAALGLRTGFGDLHLRIGGIKAFADGALGPRTAAMVQPYEGEVDNRGMLLLDSEELFEQGRMAIDNGLCIAVHAIGDRANHEVLNAFTQLRAYEKEQNTTHSFPRFPLRHRIEHVQVIHPDDTRRLAELGIIASMQPIHATSDMLMADKYWGSRAALAYAWRTQLEHGATLAFGSDAPVESPNPFWGLHAAVTRRRPDGSPGPQGWYPAQKLTISDALLGFTSGPAYASYLENQLGKLMPGFLADLTILDNDPFRCDPATIKEIRPLATMVGGKWIFREV